MRGRSWPLLGRIINFALCGLMLFGCSAENAALPARGDAPQSGPPDIEKADTPSFAQKSPQLIGYVIEDDSKSDTALSMHGFLHMAENLGYPAKLYRAKMGAEAEEAIELAEADQCKGLLIQNRDGINDAAVQKALNAGIKVIVPYDKCTLEGISANVMADEDEYIEEIAHGISARMNERKLKSGRILLYHSSPCDPLIQAFTDVMRSAYPQYQVSEFTRSAVDEASAIAELSDYFLYNRDVKGLYVIDEDLSVIAVKARTDAQTRFKADGAPSPSPEPETTPLPGQTPSPTVAPGLLTQISITIYAAGLNEENYALFSENDIYALCIEPYYEVSAQATMMLDKVLSGEPVSSQAKVNRPIVNAETIDKYSLIYNQAQELFGLQENYD